MSESAESKSESAARTQRRFGRMVRITFTLGIIAIVILFLWNGYRRAVSATLRVYSSRNLKIIGLAMHNYHDRSGTFPSSVHSDESGKPLLSWRVMILPDMEEKDLYSEFDLTQAWDSPQHAKLQTEMPENYYCPKYRRREEGIANYLVVTGPDTAFPPTRPLRTKDFKDGTSLTIMLVEHVDSDVVWTEPRDLTVAQFEKLATTKDQKSRFRTAHGDNFLVGYADGSCHTIHKDIDWKVLRAMLTPSGAEPEDRSAP